MSREIEWRVCGQLAVMRVGCGDVVGMRRLHWLWLRGGRGLDARAWKPALEELGALMYARVEFFLIVGGLLAVPLLIGAIAQIQKNRHERFYTRQEASDFPVMDDPDSPWYLRVRRYWRTRD